jgi:hypothetical protein
VRGRGRGQLVLDATVVWNGRPNRVAHPHLRVGGPGGGAATIRVAEVDESDLPKKTAPGSEAGRPRTKTKS